MSIENLVIKERCERSLLDFTRYIFKSVNKRKFQVGEHHRIICDALEKCARGEITRLIINIPPRYGKTEIAVKAFPAWCFAHNPAAKFIHLSYADPLALDNSDEVRRYIKHPAYQHLWPLEASKTKDGKKSWATMSGGTFYAGAAGGPVTGFGAGLTDDPEADHRFSGAIIIDDPIKPDDALSDTVRSKINARYTGTIASRVNSPTHTPIIVIMQRLHEDDMAGFLLAGGSGEEWHHISLPAIKDDGTPLWPEKHSIEQLRAMETANKYDFASQMMQHPVPIGDGLFKTSRMEIVAVPPVSMGTVVRYWDKAGTADAGCYTAGVKIGKLMDGRYIILDVVRGQWSAYERESVMRQTAVTDGVGCLVWIEQEPGSGGKESAEATIRNLAGFTIRAEHPTGDKVTRAVPLACQVEAGNVLMLQGDWNKAFLDELRYFPASKYKDQVDAASGAFNKLVGDGYDLFALTG